MWQPFVIGFVALVVVYILAGIRVVKQWERGIVLRFGRFAGQLQPGLRFILPGIDKMIPVDLRIIALDVPKQEAITYDNVPVRVDAVVFFRVGARRCGPSDSQLRHRDVPDQPDDPAQRGRQAPSRRASLRTGAGERRAAPGD